MKIRKPPLNGEVHVRKKIVHLRKLHAYLKNKRVDTTKECYSLLEMKSAFLLVN